MQLGDWIQTSGQWPHIYHSAFIPPHHLACNPSGVEKGLLPEYQLVNAAATTPIEGLMEEPMSIINF